MKILHVISTMKVGGAQRLLSDLLPLMSEGNEVTLLVNEDLDNSFTQKIIKAGIKIESMRCQSKSIKNIWRISKYSKGYDIVHVHLFPTVYWAAIASVFSDAKFVYTEHSTSNRRRTKWYLRPIEKALYSKYKKIISISAQTQNALMSWLRINPNNNRFTVINNGVDLARFKGLKREFPYPHTLIMVSRFVASKDQMTVIRALKYLDESVHIIFVGDGEKIRECKAFSVNEGLAERAHFVGSQSDVISWLSRADIGVQSSNWEGFGLTAVEMMAAGLPVVATDVDGLKQVVEDAGVLFHVGDEKELAGIITRLLDDEEYYKFVSSRCSEKSKQYDISHTVDGYLNIYKQLLEHE